MKIRTLVGVVAVPVVAACTFCAGIAAGADNHSGPRTVTFTEINHPDTDVDLDLGPTRLARRRAGRPRHLQQKGKDIGDVYGVGTVVQASDSGLSSQVVSTATFSDGTFNMQLMFQMNFADGPPTTRRGAITGGTGSYRCATGQCVSTVIAGSDNNTITCTST